MGAIAVIVLWLGINIITDICFEGKSNCLRKQEKSQFEKKVIKREEKVYDFDLFGELEESQVSYLKKSA